MKNQVILHKMLQHGAIGVESIEIGTIWCQIYQEENLNEKDKLNLNIKIKSDLKTLTFCFQMFQSNISINL